MAVKGTTVATGLSLMGTPGPATAGILEAIVNAIGSGAISLLWTISVTGAVALAATGAVTVLGFVEVLGAVVLAGLGTLRGVVEPITGVFIGGGLGLLAAIGQRLRKPIWVRGRPRPGNAFLRIKG